MPCLEVSFDGAEPRVGHVFEVSKRDDFFFSIKTAVDPNLNFFFLIAWTDCCGNVMPSIQQSQLGISVGIDCDFELIERCV